MSSRESDKASPSPRRTGGDAYPSGTPPYGVPQATGAFGPDGFGPAGGAAAEPAEDEGPKTETTLTTRIRINIPGSRPIPPVVVRSPVKESGDGDQPAGDGAAAAQGGRENGSPRRRAAGPASPVLGVMDTDSRPSTPPNLPPEWQVPEGEGSGGGSPESTGEWFRPRKKSGPATPAAGTPTGAAAAAAPVPAPAAPAPGGSFTPPRAPGRPSDRHSAVDEPPTSAPGRDPGLPRRSPSGAPGVPRPSGAPASPFAPSAPSTPDGPGRGTDGAGFPAAAPPAQANPYPPGLGVRSRPAPGPGAPEQPYDDAFRPDYGDDPFGTGRGNDDPFGETAVGGIPPVADAGPGETTAAFPAAAFPASDPFAGPAPANPFGAGFRDEDFRPGAPAGPGAGQPVPVTVPAPPTLPTADDDGPAGTARRPGRARKLLGYAVAAVVCAGGVAYGAGLMLNQADVPKGTTVLGVNIGGSSRDAAVHTLDSTVAKVGRQPIQLRLGGKTVALDPTAAGLSFDTTATVDGLTHHSYNPVDVIGSLTGSANAVAPQVKIDPSKLRAALQQQAGKAGGPREGYVYFTSSGQPVVVPPRAGRTVDIDAAVAAVEASYQARAQGRQSSTPIDLKVTTAEPKVSAAALQSAASTLGKKIFNGGFVYVRRGAADVPGVPFGKRTFTLALVLAPDADGKVVPAFDLTKLASRFNGAFVGRKMKHGATVGPVTAKDVADAIISGLDKTGAARAVVLPVVPG